jgi:hypothetical protein
MNDWFIRLFSRVFLLRIVIFKGLTTRRLYKSFGVKGLMAQYYQAVLITNVMMMMMINSLSKGN